ncbi:MAG: hypothetical protein KJ621_19500 [Proteobacteria bacterium]|nr:hypothetical protein [Pseudomonadota bacterium]MBU1742125.1 hypothetical protein [Pseudomonadota bacterium]
MFPRLVSMLLLAWLALAWAVPAAPAFQVKFGLRLHVDFYYAFITGTNYRGVADPAGTWGGNVNQGDLTRFYAATPSTNFLRVDWKSNDGTTGARLEFGLRAGAAHGAVAISLRKFFGWYKFGRCRLVIGKNHSLFARLTYAPYQWLGLSSRGTIGDNRGPTDLFIGWGKQNSGFWTHIGLYYTQGPWTIMVAIGNGGTRASVPMIGGGQAAVVSNIFAPRTELVVQYKGKHLSVAPGISFYMTKWETMEGVSLEDDLILSYMLVLPFHLSWGDFGFKGEIGMGRNWWAPNYAANIATITAGVFWGGLNDLTAAGRQNRLKFEDTYTYSACLGLYYRIGRATLWLSGGWQKSINASNDRNGAWRHGQNTRYGFVFAVPYRVNRHFTIAPEVSHFNYGWCPLVDVGPGPGSMYADLGSVWMAGAVFKFNF